MKKHWNWWLPIVCGVGFFCGLIELINEAHIFIVFILLWGSIGLWIFHLIIISRELLLEQVLETLAKRIEDMDDTDPRIDIFFNMHDVVYELVEKCKTER